MADLPTRQGVPPLQSSRVTRETFGAANFPVPEQHLALRNTWTAGRPQSQTWNHSPGAKLSCIVLHEQASWDAPSCRIRGLRKKWWQGTDGSQGSV